MAIRAGKYSADYRLIPCIQLTSCAFLHDVSICQRPARASVSLCASASVCQCLIHLCPARAMSAGLHMRALTALECTAPFKRQHSASPVSHKACTGSLPRATGAG